MDINNFENIPLEKVEAYSWGERDHPVVLFIDINNMNSMLSIGKTLKGHEDMFKMSKNCIFVTGNLVKNIIYWDIFCLRNMFTEKLTCTDFINILHEYKLYIHKCY